MPILHRKQAQDKWFTLTLAQQLGNIGSEYERALSWKQKNQPEHFQNAFDRMLELLDLTIADPRWQNHRLKELVRLREFICQELLEENQTLKPTLQKYFNQYALLACKNR